MKEEHKTVSAKVVLCLLMDDHSFSEFAQIPSIGLFCSQHWKYLYMFFIDAYPFCSRDLIFDSHLDLKGEDDSLLCLSLIKSFSFGILSVESLQM